MVEGEMVVGKGGRDARFCVFTWILLNLTLCLHHAFVA